ncbi:NAD(P)H-dependent oxidoreductase [Stappia sp. ES.058]|uniref:NAD(P)H-dependent oxidoreductase n=1 Tax=Stappia sp. ES.058 TaxID=1881061 RepID=UPI0008797CDA|nr:NAD(P)H-dependent oxidoreductase [Stappia sp. ES.058]SDU36850.1 Putative NADPH-quinone reductase (modulator of drug activity B) [Stappia sp. ES.058]
MRILLIQCHPSANSFGTALAGTVRASLEKGGHELRVTDLYADGFDPVMLEPEWVRYSDAKLNRAPVESHVDDILWAEALVFVYPTWWFGLPAMLKGYLDRVWVPHVTFEIPTATSPMRPRMQHIKRIGVVTTCGASWLVSKLMGEPGRKTVLRGIRALCAPRCKSTYLAHYNMDSSSADSRASFMRRVETVYSRW